jgi:hypothetical protein
MDRRQIGSVRPLCVLRDKHLGDASKEDDRSLVFDIKAGRRMADVHDYENWFDEEWKIQTGSKVRVRWYDEYFGDKRRDIRLGLSAGLVWSRYWLTAIAKRSHIAFNIAGYRNVSNLDEKIYSVWEFGPELSFRAKF